jgi:heme exporter protein CcmD
MDAPGRPPARQTAGGRLMDFLPNLDKNAAYIWACYGLGLVLIGGAVIGVLLKARAAKAALERMNASDEDAS